MNHTTTGPFRVVTPSSSVAWLILVDQDTALYTLLLALALCFILHQLLRPDFRQR